MKVSEKWPSGAFGGGIAHAYEEPKNKIVDFVFPKLKYIKRSLPSKHRNSREDKQHKNRLPCCHYFHLLLSCTFKNLLMTAQSFRIAEKGERSESSKRGVDQRCLSSAGAF